MDSSITEEQEFARDLPLSEPHFDEEATLLSAQPVVPLQEINSGARSRKRMLLGAAIVGSLMLGALAATLIYKRQEQATAIVSRAVPGSGVIAVGHDSAPSAPQIIGGIGTGKLPDAATREKQATPAASPAQSHKQAVKESKLEQKELRPERTRKSSSVREEKKDSRGPKRKDSDELLRIRDIFEGPARP